MLARLKRQRMGTTAPIVRDLEREDWPQVAAIYAAGIATGNATFEVTAPPWESWDRSHRKDLRLVASGDGGVLGWAAAAAVSERCCYSGVVEHSVYVHPDHAGRGIGRLLLSELLARAETQGIWTVQTGIFPENTASLKLHRACGFRVVGRRERIGQLGGVWRDVVLLERRFPAI